MVFYMISAKRIVSEEEKAENKRQANVSLVSELSEKTENLYQKSGQQSMVVTVRIRDAKMILCAIAKSHEDICEQMKHYIDMLPFEIEHYEMKEVTLGTFGTLLKNAYRNDYVCEPHEVFTRFSIDGLNPDLRNLVFGEGLIDSKVTYKKAQEVADSLLFESTLGVEIDRIYTANKDVKCYGHPVHYLLQTDDREIRKKIYKTLLSALYKNGRIKNQRYTYVNYDEESCFPDAAFETLYRCSAGGTVVIRYTSEESKENGFKRRGNDIIEALCEIASKYKNSVLTILCLPKSANMVKEEFLMHWGNTAFIELYEEIVSGERAKKYLKERAKSEKIRLDKKIYDLVADEEKVYTAAELNRIFSEWYSCKLRNEIYPQYKTAETVKGKIKSARPCGSAYERLESLIGLDEAKRVMKSALNYFKAQKLFADRGMIAERPSMHMVFTGNPGTAKTTVARLFAEIMKENGLLSSGNIYEVGRADIVGKYVGSTAPLVKAAFRRAQGGVLFIDEAYSLVDDRDGLFGDEAINAIVQEMENNRKDTIVIFAGYPDKMEKFLEKNPGLRSRIAFHIPFEDYSSKELCEIATLIANEKGLILTEEALGKLEKNFEEARKRSDFGNGRYVRNMIEKAKMAQANRLMSMNIDDIRDEDIRTLCVDDIEIPTQKQPGKIVRIGFCA